MLMASATRYPLVRWFGSSVFWIAILAMPVGVAHAETLRFHAAAAGQQTLDQGEGGGNPFASALLHILDRPKLKLSDLPGEVARLTFGNSRGFQAADVAKINSDQEWLLIPRASGERRSALVLVVSNYSATGGAQSLPGARLDAERIASALTKAGFATETALDLSLAEMRAKLTAFADQSEYYDAALVYTTGHGVEVGGEIYLIPGDYPIQNGNTALTERALSLGSIANALRAKRVNLLFYGGCRDNPFAN